MRKIVFIFYFSTFLSRFKEKRKIYVPISLYGIDINRFEVVLSYIRTHLNINKIPLGGMSYFVDNS